MERSGMEIRTQSELKLTEYERQKFREFEAKSEYATIYRVDPNRPDLPEYVRMLKRRAFIYNDVYIYGEFESFERVYVPEFEKMDRINYWGRVMDKHREENPLTPTITYSDGKRKGGRAV